MNWRYIFRFLHPKLIVNFDLVGNFVVSIMYLWGGADGVVVLRPGAGAESRVFQNRLSLVTLHTGGTGWTLQHTQQDCQSLIKHKNSNISIYIHKTKLKKEGWYVVPPTAFALVASYPWLLLENLGHLYYLPNILVTNQNSQLNINEYNHRVYK